MKYSVIYFIGDELKKYETVSTFDSIESAYNGAINEIERTKKSKDVIEDDIRSFEEVSEEVLNYKRPYMSDSDIGICVGYVTVLDDHHEEIDVYFEILVTEC